MFTKDTSEADIKSLVAEVKSAVTLDAESQSPKYSGHESGEYGEGGPEAAKTPGGGRG